MCWSRRRRGERRRLTSVALIAATATLVSGCGNGDDVAAVYADDGAREVHGLRQRATSAPRDAAATTSAAPTTSTTTTTTTTTTPTTTVPTGVAVIQVVDGDTIEVAGGQRVRLIGIDAPERGACGHREASDALAEMVRSRHVVLLAGARGDTDRYGRLLRYVEVDGVDVNLEMLRQRRAIARYDSRDGHGRHPREDAYVAASPLVASGCGATSDPPTTTAPAPAAPATGDTDPRFGTCKDAIAAGYGPYRRGVDPEYDWYRDADGDGEVCER